MLKQRALASEFVECVNGEERWKIPGRYKAAAVWSSIRPKQEKVAWHKLVWFSINVPKHSFISWMAILNRLLTRDGLREWGVQVEESCVLCQIGLESRSHLFFGCSFSKEIWKRVLRLCNLRREVMEWENELK